MTQAGGTTMFGRMRSRAKIGAHRIRGSSEHVQCPFPGHEARPAPRSIIGLTCLGLILSASLGLLLPSARAQTDPKNVEPAHEIGLDAVVCVEIPQPEALIDRLLDPRTQKYLSVLPQYRQFLEGEQFKQLQAVANLIATQVGTTWERGLRDLTGGGIIAVVAGQEPRISLLITPKDPALLQKAHQVLLKMARQDAKDKGTPDPVRMSNHHGLDVYMIGGEKGPAYAIIAGKLAISNSLKNLERLIEEHDNARSTGDRHGAIRVKPALTRIADQPEWKALRERQGSDVVAWGYVNLEKLKQLDAQRFTLPPRANPGITFLFASWYEALRRAPVIKGSIRWSTSELGATLELPLSKEGRPAMVKGYVPEAGHGNAPLLRPPGTIASLSLWRDFGTLWESRADLFAPEVAQGLAQLDTVAGQFFGGREFGPDVLGGFDPHVRLVVADQDYRGLKPEPDPKIPAFALVAELNAPDDDFAPRLKIAFQSLVAISNVEAAQKKAPVMELGSENVEGITMATTRFLVPRTSAPASEQALQRYNYTPAAAQVGKFFILSSSTSLARDLVKELKAAGGGRSIGSEATSTLTLEADGPELARLLEKNHSRMVMQSVLKQGETKEKAEQRVGLNLSLLRYLRHGQLVVRDDPDATRFQLKFELSH